MKNKLMPEVPTEEILSNIATQHEVSIEEASYLYEDVYAIIPSVECEPVAWRVTGPYQDNCFKDKSSAIAWQTGLNKGFGEDKYLISPLYTIPQDQPPQPPKFPENRIINEDKDF